MLFINNVCLLTFLRTPIKTLIAWRSGATVNPLGKVTPVMTRVVHFAFWTNVMISLASETVPILGTAVGVRVPPIRLAAAIYQSNLSISASQIMIDLR